MKIKFEWEVIDKVTKRSKVFGGWIVRTFNHLEYGTYFACQSQALVFIPDQYHQWEISNEI